MLTTNLSPDCLGIIAIVTPVLFVDVTLILENNQLYVAANRPAVATRDIHDTIDV